jgi:chorismate mutase
MSDLHQENSAPSADAVPAITDVEDGRQRLDDIDDELHKLLRRRRELSRQIQQLRLEQGGVRIEHGREQEIIRRWSAALGASGPELALAVLRLCRGAVPTHQTTQGS